MAKITAQLTRLRVTIALLVIIVLGLIIFALSRPQTPDALPDLATTTATVSDVEKIVKADGNAEGRDTKSVYFTTGGEVTDIRVKVGDKPKKGAIVAAVKTTSALGENTEYITAPLNRATVTAISFEEGDIVANGTLPAISFVDETEYVIEVSVNENDIVDVKTGQTAEILFPSISLDDTYEGKVSDISLSPITGSAAVDYLVEVTLEDKPSDLRLGMSADVEILSARREDVLSIPENFLIEKNDKYFVKVLNYTNSENTEYEIVDTEVEIGLRTDTLVEITDGISSGTQVLEPSFNEERQFSLFSS